MNATERAPARSRYFGIYERRAEKQPHKRGRFYTYEERAELVKHLAPLNVARVNALSRRDLKACKRGDSARADGSSLRRWCCVTRLTQTHTCRSRRCRSHRIQRSEPADRGDLSRCRDRRARVRFRSERSRRGSDDADDLPRARRRADRVAHAQRSRVSRDPRGIARDSPAR